MKKNLTTVFLFLFWCACQKPFPAPVESGPSPTDTLPGNPAGGQDSVLRLEEISFTDFDSPEPYKFKTQRFFYDRLKRIEHINTYYYNMADSLFSVATYHYLSDDSFAFQKTEIFPAWTPPDNWQTEFYQYDNAHRLQYDSIVNSVYAQAYHFTYANPFIFSSITQYTFGTGKILLKKDTSLLNSAGNIEQLKIADVASAPDITLTTFQYDSGVNPFMQLNIRSTYRPVYDYYLETDRDPFYFMSNNNITNITEHVGAEVYTSDFSYGYNSLNRTILQYYTRSRSVLINTQVAFTYRKL